jgi:hypothetical protein
MSILREDYRHSASRANAFIDSPAHWIITELFNYKEPANARMLMGLSAEEAAHEGLKGGTEDLIRCDAESAFRRMFAEANDTKTDDERIECEELHWCQEIAVNFVNSLKEFGEVISYQNEKIVSQDTLKFPIKCITDFEFKDVIIDTKATAYLKRLKSGKLDANWYPKDSDIRQQLLYKRIYNKPTMLLYASAKDQEAIDMLDRTANIDLIQVFHTMEYICSIAKTKEEVVKMFPLNVDNFRWGKGMTDIKKFATDVWNTVWKT